MQHALGVQLLTSTPSLPNKIKGIHEVVQNYTKTISKGQTAEFGVSNRIGRNRRLPITTSVTNDILTQAKGILVPEELQKFP